MYINYKKILYVHYLLSIRHPVLQLVNYTSSNIETSSTQNTCHEPDEIIEYVSVPTPFRQEPITRCLHMCCALESTLSSKEAFPRKYIVS